MPVLQVADASVAWEPSTIRRRGRLKTVTVSSEFEHDVIAADVAARLRPWLLAEQAGWCPGYRYPFGGQEETSSRANQSIAEQSPVAGLIILLLLIIAQFNSIRGDVHRAVRADREVVSKSASDTTQASSEAPVAPSNARTVSRSAT